jgi:dihydroflavonol-4-reductase
MIAAITGATGHVGVTLSRLLLSRGHHVRAIVRRDARGLEGLDVEKVEGDVRNPESLVRAFRGTDVVFHAAARISITRIDTAEVAETNISGTRHVIAACRETGVRRLVHFSSIEALEPLPLDTPLDEKRPFVEARTASPYAVSKAQAEGEVRRAMAAGLDAVILNPTAIIGPWDFKPSLLGSALLSIAGGRLPMLVDGGFDWVDVRDVAEAALAAAERGPAGSSYIVGGRWASMAELARHVCNVTGARLPGLTCPFWIARAWAPVSAAYSRIAGKTPLFTGYSLSVLRGNRTVSHDRAARDLDYRPRDLEESVTDACAWFEVNGYLRPRWGQAVRNRAASGGSER